MKLQELSKDDKLSLSKKVYNALKEAILSLNIKPKDHLYISDLSSFYNISNTPIREALIQLEKEGWIETKGRRGALVLSPSGSDFLNIVELHAVLWAHISSKLAIDNKNGEILKEIKDIQKRSKNILAGNSRKEDPEIVRIIFSTLLIKNEKNNKIVRMIHEYSEYINRIRRMLWNIGEAPVEKSIKEHIEVLDAILKNDGVKAYSLMYEHEISYDQLIAQRLEDAY